MKRWISSDYHLGEDRFQIMQRPFQSRSEMVETLIRNHNSVVSKDDEVHIVGDVCYDQAPEYLPYIDLFNGKKILYRGNHDRVFTDDQLKPYFEEIIPEGELSLLDVGNIKCALNHYPTKAVPDYFNLVGHIHSVWKYQLNMFNVGVDANHFYPHNIDEAVPFVYKAINEYYDDDVWAAYHIANKARKTRFFVT